MKKYDFIIIGSGIIGLTVAHALKNRKANAHILVLDKEWQEPGMHQAIGCIARWFLLHRR